MVIIISIGKNENLEIHFKSIWRNKKTMIFMCIARRAASPWEIRVANCVALMGHLWLTQRLHRPWSIQRPWAWCLGPWCLGPWCLGPGALGLVPWAWCLGPGALGLGALGLVPWAGCLGAWGLGMFGGCLGDVWGMFGWDVWGMFGGCLFGWCFEEVFGGCLGDVWGVFGGIIFDQIIEISKIQNRFLKMFRWSFLALNEIHTGMFGGCSGVFGGCLWNLQVFQIWRIFNTSINHGQVRS